ncbi:hypothetical protein DPMN_101497 [Dreissena polymorpha]|uniref:Ig-like domain-containing protein n=1 Tax=Dreissena polymorpha TaxID=45954 RepID=A0A9D4R8D8_DREPO|nr:hypothetical protein DPMN_101497 [Dreissena polymorpha]
MRAGWLAGRLAGGRNKLMAYSQQFDHPVTPVIEDSAEHSLSVIPGSTAILPCRVRNTGDIIVAWFDGQWEQVTTGTTIKSSNPRLSIQNRDPDEWNLVIKDVTAEDAQIYVCQVQFMPPSMKTVTLTVHDTPKVNKTSINHRYSFKTGSRVTIECHVSGSPPPTVTWYFYETNSTSIEEKKIKVSSSKLLDIRTADKSKDGIYRCEATNDHGQDKYEIYLEITYPPVPTITTKQVSVKENSQIRLVCKAESKPAPNFAWFHSGQNITTSKRHHVSHDTEDMEFQVVSELTIRQVEVGDSGKYTCSASNIHGREDAETLLQVIPQPGSSTASIQPKPPTPDKTVSTQNVNTIVDTETPRTDEVVSSSASCLLTTVLMYLHCSVYTIFYML